MFILTTYYLRWLKAIFIIGTSLAIIIHAHIRGQVLQYKAELLKRITVQIQAPSMILMQEYKGCDTQCTAAAGLIHQVKRIHEKINMEDYIPDEYMEEEDYIPDEYMEEEESIDDMIVAENDNENHNSFKLQNNQKWIDILSKYRKSLINPDNQQYVFVDERILLKSKNKSSSPKYTYVTRAHIDKSQINVDLKTAQKSVDNMCKSKRCNLRSILQASFEKTNLTDKRYAIIDYPWYDPITNTEIIKRSIIYRIHKNFVVGSGFTLTKEITKPNVPVIALCVFIYALFLLYTFVYPGLFYNHGEILSERTLNVVKRNLWESKNTYIVLSTLVLTLFLSAQHAQNIKQNENIKTNILVQQLSDRRYFAILLASLALALGFFASFQRKYERNILPALLVSFLFSLLALLDLFGGNDNQTYLLKIHLTRTFLTCAIVTLLWLFVTLTIQWHTHQTH